MYVEYLKNLIDGKKTVKFFLSEGKKELEAKGKYACEIISEDTNYFLFADTIELLLNKLERKNVQDMD